MASPKTLQFFILITSLTISPNSQPAKSEIPAFSFSWLANNETFVAGDAATIKVKVLGNYEGDKYEFPFKPNITVNDKMGNSSFITGVCCHFDGGTENWSIGFVPIMVGLFNLLITDEHFRVLDSSLHFQVIPGEMYPPAGILTWVDGTNEFIAGTRGKLLILPKDAFGNNVSSTSEGSKHYNFSLSALTSNGSLASLLNTTYNGWNEKGYLSFEFIAATAGNLLLHVEIENQTLHGSPLPFVVNQGNLDVRSSVARLNIETKYFQLLSVMEGLIIQQDQYGNVVSELHEFDIEVVEKGTNLSMPLADLVFGDIRPGLQSFSFSLPEPGDFMLLISDKEKNTLISNMPYDFSVYIGYCDGVNSIVNGSGLNNSVAGEMEAFSVFLRDAYLYPSRVELQTLQVQIVKESDPQIIRPSIRIRETSIDGFNGRLNYEAIDVMQFASAPMGNNSQFTEKLDHKASDFDVTYKLEKIGVYEIRVFCGNIALNGGNAYRKVVRSGVVNESLSGVVKFEQKVAKMVKNEIVVRLMDSFSNPVLLQQSKLRLEIASINKSAFSSWVFLDNHDGSYTAEYLANDVGTYEICASYNGHRFLPCPFGVNVYEHEYFPRAYNDTVSVWEDESIGFNAVENDFLAGGNASIVEYSKPNQGSLLLYGSLFRYTPYKGYYGNDSFSYTISDVNRNLAFGVVDLLVLCRPPHFVSIPSNLQATEDIVSPTFGGFSGFEITYSDLFENISITLGSNSGTILLSPIQIRFWQADWDQLSVHVGVANELNLVGSLEVVNFALQSIQYFGHQDFYGDDTIRVSTRNKNGRNDIDVPIYVQPINDPPIINIPPFVILDNMSDGVRVFGKQDTSNFIQDPDSLNFPGNKTHFLVLFAMEVSVGVISTSLPSELVGSTEVKQKTSCQWQPLQTFVTISKHFLVKAKGIRFRGTIDDCNSIMGQLSYHEGEDGGVLTLRVNDLGNHGCYPNCNEMMSMSLFAESTVNLITHRPITSLAAHTLGTIIILESIAVCCLGLMLLFFICKCALLLVHEKKRQKSSKQTVSWLLLCRMKYMQMWLS